MYVRHATGNKSGLRNYVVAVIVSVLCSALVPMPAADAQVSGQFALEFFGSEYVTIPSTSGIEGVSPFTVEQWLWVNPTAQGSINVSLSYESAILPPGTGYYLGMYQDHYRILIWDDAQNFHRVTHTPSPLTDYLGRWVHIAAVVETDRVSLYLDGELVVDHTGNFAAGPSGTLMIGLRQSERGFQGVIDEVRMWNTARTQEELQEFMTKELAGDEPGLVGYWKFDEGEGTIVHDSSPYGNHGTITGASWTTNAVPLEPLSRAAASRPVPPNEAEDVLRNVVLSWEPGIYAATHNVYFSTDFDDVNAASSDALVSQGQTATTYDPGVSLAYGQTYYWRVDEVNSAPDFSVHEGNVWSFTVEPVAYPLDNVVATASIPSDSDKGPENVVNRSGLTDGQHGTQENTMWEGIATADDPVWVQFEFDRVHKLHKMQVWNYNVAWESILGFGAKDVTIEYATDANEWTTLGEYRIDQAPGTADYTGMPLDLEGIAAKYVRMNINSNWITPNRYGLSEVIFYSVPVYAREPMPQPGATVEPDVVLSWRAGREAESSLIYFGTDQNDVADDVALLDATTTNMYDLGTVNLGATYYWKITEVNEAETPTSWAGDIWSFSTPEFVVVDDFEDYDDDDNRIYYAWLDGYGVATNGSQVGHDGAPYAEETIVRSGSQSMPLQYGQEGATTSEATLTLGVPQDWTAAGITTLVVYFRGELGNAPAQLYAKINNTRVDFPGDPAALAAPLWKQWNIDLTLLGNAASNVTSLTIGVSGSGSGRLFVDDIRLHATAPDAPEAAVDPGTANLMAYYPMSGNAADASGNGYDGTVETGSSFGDGPTGYGQAVVLDGASGHVTLPIGSLIQSLDSITVAGWVRRNASGSWQRFFDFGNDNNIYMFITTNASGGGVRFAITTSSAGGESGMTSAQSIPSNGMWHHVAGTIDGSTGEMKLYVDGALVGSTVTETLPSDLGETTQNWIGRSQWPDPYLNGAVDEFRIYDRALSEGEVRYLVGDR